MSFNPEMTAILGRAFDAAWRLANEPSFASTLAPARARDVLARHIIYLARQGVRETGLLERGALGFLASLSAQRTKLQGRDKIARIASTAVGQSFRDEEDILEYLGAALVMRWDTLPTKIQRELFEHASAIAELATPISSSEPIVRLLHKG
jgi:hypothetical protein